MSSDRWQTKSLGDVTEVNPPPDPTDPSALVSVVPMAAVEVESGRLSPGEPTPYREARRGLRPFREGDVLFAKITPSMENGKSAVARGLHGGRGFGSTEFHVIRPGPSIDADYIRYFLVRRKFRSRARSHMTGTAGQLRVPAGYLEAVTIPLPPLDVQRRTVADLDGLLTRLEAAEGALRRAAKSLTTYRRASLQAALASRDEPAMSSAKLLLEDVESWRRRRWAASGPARPYRAPAAAVTTLVPTSLVGSGWAIATLEQLTDPVRTISYGILMPKDDMPDGIPYVRVKDMAGDRIDVPRLKRTAPEIAAAYARSSLKGGDVLVSIRGTYGRVAVVPPELEGANITQDTARLDLSPLIDQRFVLDYLRGPIAQRYLSSVARGVAVKGVNIADLRLLPVPIPPLEEQGRIADELEQRTSNLDDLATELVVSLRRSGALREKVLQAAFNGVLGDS